MPRTLIGNFKGPKGNTGEQGIQGPPGPQGPAGEKGDPGMVDENTPIIFEVPKEYEAPEPGDAIKALFGKIAKGLSDLFAAIGVLASLKTVDKSTLVAAVNELAEGKFDVAKLVASTTITEPGFAMDGQTASEAFAELYSKNEYSFDETRTGTWIDGKPLYRKTIIQPASQFVPSEGIITYSVPHNTPNISNVLMCYGFMQASDLYPLPYFLSSNGECDTFLTIVGRTNIIICNRKADWEKYNLVVIMEYTKTID